MKRYKEYINSKGFTLIELLVVIAIIAILVLIVVVVINPAERLNQARDTTASSDVRSVASAVGSCITTELGRSSTGNAYGKTVGSVVDLSNSCGDSSYLETQKFAENVPAGIEFSGKDLNSDGKNDKICIYEQGRTGKYASWVSNTGSMIAAPNGIDSECS